MLMLRWRRQKRTNSRQHDRWMKVGIQLLHCWSNLQAPCSHINLFSAQQSNWCRFFCLSWGMTCWWRFERRSRNQVGLVSYLPEEISIERAILIRRSELNFCPPLILTYFLTYFLKKERKKGRKKNAKWAEIQFLGSTHPANSTSDLNAHRRA